MRLQVRRAVRVQATLLTAIALLAGVPCGIAAGRWLWTLFAREQGIIPEPLLHGVTLIAGIPLTLLAACAIAAPPARRAARTQPATTLRTE